MLKAVWNLRKSQPAELLQKVKATPEYAQLAAQVGIQVVLDKEVSSMCRDLQSFESHKYVVDKQNNRIGYKEMDGTTYSSQCGYSTAFAHLSEVEKGNFKDGSFKYGMTVACGCFSFANIQPTRILGVSGTLQVLGASRWQILNRYEIHLCSLMPSIYVSSNLRPCDHPLTISSSEEFFTTVAKEVKHHVDKNEAVLVFFDTSENVQKFRSSNVLKVHDSRIQVLLESLTDSQKDDYVRHAATKGKVTIAPAVFGRGTDFAVTDDTVVHCIQALVSIDECEEEQIKGRVARQGKSGTHCLVLSESDIHTILGEDIGLSSKSPKDQISNLHAARAKQQGKAAEELLKSLAVAEKWDKVSREYSKALFANNAELAIRKLTEIYART